MNISCELTVTAVTASSIEIVSALSSPVPDDLTASRYLFALDVANQVLYRCNGNDSPNFPVSSWTVWETFAMPDEDWIALASNPNQALVMLMGSTARIATKQFTAGPGSGVDSPFVSYDVDTPLHGGIPYVDPPEENVFWEPTEVGVTCAALNDTGGLVGSIVSNGTSPPVITGDNWNRTNANPAGSWCKILGENGDPGDARNAALFGPGDKFYRWFDAIPYNDADWVEVPCPDEEWTDACWTDKDVAVAVGTNAVAFSGSGFTSFSAVTMPVGWTAESPRVAFDPGMFDETSDGTILIAGGQISGVDVLICIPVNGTTLGTPVVATLPALPTGFKLNTIAIGEQIGMTFNVISALAPNGDIYFLCNDDTAFPAAYNDWQLKTISEAPF